MKIVSVAPWHTIKSIHWKIYLLRAHKVGKLSFKWIKPQNDFKTIKSSNFIANFGSVFYSPNNELSAPNQLTTTTATTTTAQSHFSLKATQFYALIPKMSSMYFFLFCCALFLFLWSYSICLNFRSGETFSIRLLFVCSSVLLSNRLT